MARYLGLAFLASSIPWALAQTFTDCNPLQAACPADPGINSAVFSTDFTKSSSVPAGWTQVNQGTVTYDGNGANFILAKQGDSPTLVSNGYILFGSMEVVIKSAPGQGVVSSLILLSDDLDELDWEFIGGNNGQVQSNYFGKGDTTTYDRAAWHNVANPEGQFHSYKFDWTPQAVTFSINGVAVRTLNYADAQGGTRFPQTPMRVKVGIWAGGDPSNGPGTIQWAGGLTDYSQAPFTMTIQSITVQNYSPASGYTYGDNSGSYQSIKVSGGSLMSNKGVSGASAGTTAAGAATTQAATLTTSLSLASEMPTNPLSNAATANVTANTSKPTGAATVLPSSSFAANGTVTKSTPSASASNAAGSSVVGTSSALMGALALLMAMFA